MADEATRGGVPVERPERALERRFSDEEVQELIRKALALQERSATTPQAGHTRPEGLTIDDVRHIAAEVGIDPRFVEEAVDGGLVDAERTGNWFVGAPYEWRFRETVAGEVDEKDWGRLIDAIRAEIGQKGEVQDVFGTLEWSHNDGLGPILVSVRSEDGRTHVELTGSRSGSLALIHGLGIPLGGLVLGGLVAGATGLSGLAVLPVLASTAGLSWLVGRIAWRPRARHWERKLRLLTERVAGAAARVAHLFPPADPDT